MGQVRDALGNRFGYKNEEKKYLANAMEDFTNCFLIKG